jgi:catechol 2,3-dioxygenase-like lactoylglutathione lyase family enzyme
MVKKYLHTRYRVSDLEKTVGFHRDVLGLRKTRRHTSPLGSKLVFLTVLVSRVFQFFVPRASGIHKFLSIRAVLSALR